MECIFLERRKWAQGTTPGDPENKEDYKLKLDLRDASYEEILEVWSNQQTEYGGQEGPYKLYDDGTLLKVLRTYFEKEVAK